MNCSFNRRIEGRHELFDGRLGFEPSGKASAESAKSSSSPDSLLNVIPESDIPVNIVSAHSGSVRSPKRFRLRR